MIRNETLRGQRHVVSKECRQQVRAQLFQQRENINFDPKLKNACQHEIKKYCNDVPHGGGQVKLTLLTLACYAIHLSNNFVTLNITYRFSNVCKVIRYHWALIVAI